MALIFVFIRRKAIGIVNSLFCDLKKVEKWRLVLYTPPIDDIEFLPKLLLLGRNVSKA